MKIEIAGHIGFCFGVRRAVDIAENALNSTGAFFCLGPLIHNPQEVKRLSEKGLKIIDDVRNINRGSTLIMRSHGLTPDIIETARRRGIKLIDTTCPFVKKAQNICKILYRENFDVIVVGEKYHPEVKSLVGFTENKATVVENINDVKKIKLPAAERRGCVLNIGIIAQTTQSRKNLQDLAGAIFRKCGSEFDFGQLKVFNTICKDSATRQIEAKEISLSCDAMLVVGGKNSANSRRLVKICKEVVSKTYHIETAAQIKTEWFFKGKFGRFGRIGIVSGASTPDWIIEAVIRKLKSIAVKNKAFKLIVSKRHNR